MWMSLDGQNVSNNDVWTVGFVSKQVVAMLVTRSVLCFSSESAVQGLCGWEMSNTTTEKSVKRRLQNCYKFAENYSKGVCEGWGLQPSSRPIILNRILIILILIPIQTMNYFHSVVNASCFYAVMMDFGWERHPCAAGVSWLWNSWMSKMTIQNTVMAKWMETPKTKVILTL